VNLCQTLTIVAATGVVSPGCAVQPQPLVPDSTGPVLSETPPDPSSLPAPAMKKHSSEVGIRIAMSGTGVAPSRGGSRLAREDAARSEAVAATQPTPSTDRPKSSLDDGEDASGLAEMVSLPTGGDPDSAVREALP
jgi:hypothetical protein